MSKNDIEQATKILHETARMMGLSVCAVRYGHEAIRIAPEFDGFDAWLGAPTVRTRVLFPYHELVGASPDALCASIARRCRDAKEEIVATLKAALAHLESAA